MSGFLEDEKLRYVGGEVCKLNVLMTDECLNDVKGYKTDCIV